MNTLDSLDFERQVARIAAVLEGAGAEVKWNDRLVDPDNPTQKRQIDVTISRDEQITIVECRLHSRPQDVKWVEELYGRKVSLRAGAVMGVSSSGFTAGAMKKAERLGVFLRNLGELTDEEVTHWGCRTRVHLSYVHFPRGAEIFLVPDTDFDIPIQSTSALFTTKYGTPWPLGMLFHEAASKIASSGTPEGFFRMQFFTSDLFIGSVPVAELLIGAEWKWVRQEIVLPYVLSFHDPLKRNCGGTYIEKNNYSKTEIFHTPEHAIATVDISQNPPFECSYLRSIDLDFGRPMRLGGIGIIGLTEQCFTLFPLSVSAINKRSAAYRALTSEAGIQLIAGV
jgi:hypothetical protein